MFKTIKTAQDLAASREAQRRVAEREEAENEARAYLMASDWYVTRAAEPNGKPIPKDVLKKRREAREVLK